jgi:ubiquinone/menaquinone biosynthesis C-methylase UbiE
MAVNFHNTHSNTNDRMAGGCTTLNAIHIVSSLRCLYFPAPITSSSTILNNACGTGLMTAEIKKRYPNTNITAVDLSPAMIEQAKSRAKENGWDNITTDVLDIRDLKTLRDESFSHVITNFGIQAAGGSDLEGPLMGTKEIC